jgi:hypothetical protein
MMKQINYAKRRNNASILRGGILLFTLAFLSQNLWAQYNCNTLYASQSVDGVTGNLVSVNTANGGATFLRAMPTGAACNLALGPAIGGTTPTMYAANCPAGSTFQKSTGGAWSSAGFSITPAKISGVCARPWDGWIFGISSTKQLYRWNGTGNFTSIGTLTGDAVFNGGFVCADLACDAQGSLYCFVVGPAAVYAHIYKINPNTLVATRFKTTTLPVSYANGNDPAFTVIGMAYLNGYFYVSQGKGANGRCDFYKVDGNTGTATRFAVDQQWTIDFASCGIVPPAVEVCNGGIDDDGDGLSDWVSQLSNKISKMQWQWLLA